MAKQEQVVRIKRNFAEWNPWRQEHPEIQPDLILANLSGTNLSHANLGDANLRYANLSNANLGYTNLNHANLHYANLSDADLSNTDLRNTDLRCAKLRDAELHYAKLSDADLSNTDLRSASLRSASLSDADLSDADLSGANLSGANLSGANLSGTNLHYANLSGTNLRYTNLCRTDFSHANLSNSHLSYANFNLTIFNRTLFAWEDLSNVKELETAMHFGPSAIDINSVILPHDERTRNHFLRGAGFTETQIEYLPSLLTPRPIEYASLFISYACQDEAVAKRLHADLRKKDVPCWFAPHDLRPGTPILRGIEEAIHLQDKFLLILSKYAVNSRWVEREVDAALYQEIERGSDVLFPVRLDNTVLESNAGWATRLQHRHIGDFTRWQDDNAYQQAFATLLRHLKVAKPPTV